MAKPNWEAIEQEFRTGQLSIRAIAAKYHVSDGVIRKRAKANGWVRTGIDGAQKSTHRGQNAHGDVNQLESSSTGSGNGGVYAPKQQDDESILKEQWEQFAQNISQGMLQRDAAICAGYSPKSADSQASILLRQPAIKARIKELRADAALLATFNAKDLAELSYDAATKARNAGLFSQVAPNVKNAAQLIGVDMSTGKTSVDVNLGGLSYGKVCIVTPSNCDAAIWSSHMDKLREGKQTARS